jgi:hypothetical protein
MMISFLLFKAYAKLHGSYQVLESGTAAEAMVDMTGGVVDELDLAQERVKQQLRSEQLQVPLENCERELWKYLKRAASSSLIGCSLRVVAAEPTRGRWTAMKMMTTADGIILNHSYAVMAVQTVKIKGFFNRDKHHLVRIRNVSRRRR